MWSLRRRPRRPMSAVARAIVQHLVVSVLALAVVGIASTVIMNRIAGEEAIRDAEGQSRAIAGGVLAPLVTQQVRDGDPLALARLDAAAHDQLALGQILRIKVWSADGVVLYCDVPDLIGERFPFDPEDEETLRSGGVESDISDVGRPENRFERGLGQVVEVYLGETDATGQPVLIETYVSSVRLAELQRSLTARVVPVVLASLVLLGLLLVPLSVRLAKRVERYEQERLALVRMAAAASAAERRRVAGQLHDGVIQDLSGVNYALTAVERRLAELDQPDLRSTVRTTLDVIRTDLVALRSLITTLYAADLGTSDVAEGLAVVARDLELRGVTIDIQIGELPVLPHAVANATFQVAREALRNVASHAAASTATLRLEAVGHDLVLTVTDDGQGFDPDAVVGPVDGHLGLSLLRDSAAGVDGRLSIDSTIGVGTTVRLAVPLAGQPADVPGTGSPLPEDLHREAAQRQAELVDP